MLYSLKNNLNENIFTKNNILLLLIFFVCIVFLILTSSKKNKAKVTRMEHNLKKVLAPIALIIYFIGVISILISNMKDYAIYSVLAIILIAFLTLLFFIFNRGDKYTFLNNKKLYKSSKIFRELPCDGDIYKVYWIVNKYGVCKNKENFFKAILLKWFKQEKIKIEDKKTIILYENINLDNELEKELYNYLYIASKDGKLEQEEFEVWSLDYQYKILLWLDNVLEYEEEKLIKEGKVIKEVRSKYSKAWFYKADDSIYEDATKLMGLKQFFHEFEPMRDKELIEVKLWENYLVYAQIMGEADKLDIQFKNLFPVVIAEDTYEKVEFVKEITRSK